MNKEKKRKDYIFLRLLFELLFTLDVLIDVFAHNENMDKEPLNHMNQLENLMIIMSNH